MVYGLGFSFCLMPFWWILLQDNTFPFGVLLGLKEQRFKFKTLMLPLLGNWGRK